jgi:hypothetical protein
VPAVIAAESLHAGSTPAAFGGTGTAQ